MMTLKGQVCTKGVWDETVPGITFDDKGVSNYARIQERMMADFPRGKKGKADWEALVDKVKKSGRGKEYDCIIGVSGGVDSSYLLHICKNEYGLRPLAVNFDNGWSSDIAVKNIRKVTQKLDIDLETYVVDYEEMKDLLRTYMRASLPWIDGPTDTAIKATMYKIARQTGVKYVFRGNDFRSEGKQPREWTYSGSRQMKYLHRKYGELNSLSSFPDLTLFGLIWSGYVRGIKDIRPYYFLEYKKQDARTLLEKEYGWEYYGGHHHENIFTKFAMSAWLPGKFGIDKRKITLSAQILSGAISREEAIAELEKPPADEDGIEKMTAYVLKKLDISTEEYETIWNAPNKYYDDYPSDISLIMAVNKYLLPLVRLVYPIKPMSFYEIDGRAKEKGVPAAEKPGR
jgi:N-acetyl sugar amidotransferase